MFTVPILFLLQTGSFGEMLSRPCDLSHILESIVAKLVLSETFAW